MNFFRRIVNRMDYRVLRYVRRVVWNYLEEKRGGGGGISPYTKLEQIQAQLNFIQSLLLESNKDNLNNLFNSIYKANAWGCGSGPGSNAELCAGYVAFLQDFFKENKIQSIVDCGCGDWQFSQFLDFSGISYQGFDVAEFVISKNTAQFQKENVQFHHYNGDFSALPAADLLICKDVLQHLNNARIQDFLRQLPRFKFALLTNDINGAAENALNCDITSSGYRPLDLRLPPFSADLKIVYQITRMPHAPDMPVMLWTNPKN